MASDHVDVIKPKENATVFNIFNRLIKSNIKKEKSCAALIDFWKSSEENVGSTSAELYSTKRLVRGLAASEIERQNTFFAALCTALSCGGVSTDNVISSLASVLESIGTSKSEHNTAMVTNILTYGAIVKAGKFEELDKEKQTEAIKLMISASNSRSYLKTASCVFLVDYLTGVAKNDFKSVFLPIIKQEIESQKELQNEFYAITGIAFFRFQKLMQKLIDGFFGGRYQFLQEYAQRGLYFAPVIQEDILKLFCVELSSSGSQFLKIWKALLENEPKHVFKWYSYILLLAKILMDVLPNDETIVQMLQHKFIDVIFKSLQSHDKAKKSEHYYIRARQVLDSMVARLSAKEANHGLQAIKIILTHPFGLQFDRKTRTNTLQSLMTSLSDENLKSLADEFVAMLKAGLENEEKSKMWKELEQTLLLLVKILNHPGVKKDTEVYIKYSKIVFNYAFLKSITVGKELRSKAVELFYKTLDNHLKIDDAIVLLNGLVKHANENLDKLVVDLKESDKVQWKNMLETNDKLAVKSSDRKFVAVRLLLLHMGLLMFRDQELASSTIVELLQCHQRLKKKSKTDEEPHWVEVTVDLLLAMLSRENKLLRHVVGSVFPSIVPNLTGTALQQIVDALDPAARNDVLKHVESDDSEDESENEEEEEDDEEEDEGEESAGSDVDGEEETVNDKLRMAVRNALGYSAALTDDESVDMDNMNEEEERRLNESLSNAFKLFKPNKGSKKKQSKDDEAMTHFRVRVLDLVEIIVGTNPPLSSCLELINPLIGLLEYSIKDPHQKPLQNRLESVLKKLGSVKKFGNVTDVNYSDLVATFKSLFARDTSGMVYVEMAPSITEVSGLLVRASQLIEKKSKDERLEDVFGQLLDRFFKTNDRKIPFGVFQSTLRILWDGNWDISKKIMNLLLEPDLKLFKKLKCLELLEIFYRNDRLQSTATDDSKKAASSFEAKFVKKFAKTLGDYDKKKSKLLPTFLSRLLPFIQMAIQTKTRYRGNCLPAPAWDLVVKHLLDNAQILPLTKTKNKLSFLAQQCKLPLPELKAKKQMTQESSSEDEQEEMETEKQKKRKFKPESKKQKKESRELREVASSQGLGAISFAGINLDALAQNESDDSDDDAPDVKKPKKLEKKKKK